MFAIILFYAEAFCIVFQINTVQLCRFLKNTVDSYEPFMFLKP